MPDQIYAYPMPLSQAEEYADEHEEAHLALYEDDATDISMPLVVTEDDATAHEISKTAAGRTRSDENIEWPLPADEIRERSMLP